MIEQVNNQAERHKNATFLIFLLRRPLPRGKILGLAEIIIVF